jgi:hypothetical protein
MLQFNYVSSYLGSRSICSMSSVFTKCVDFFKKGVEYVGLALSKELTIASGKLPPQLCKMLVIFPLHSRPSDG